MNKKNKKKASNQIFYILMFIFAAVFVFSAFMLFSNISKGKKEQAVFDDMSQAVHQLEENTTTEGDSNPLAEHYLALKEQNEDFIGWIKIEGTLLDYPVMHTPNDPEYYLRRSFDESYAISGTPFMAAECTLDDNAVMIYGHHMKNGTMFAPLHNFKDKAFWENHQNIYFDIVEERRTYEIISAFYTEVSDSEAFPYYSYIGNLSDEDFEYYCNNVMGLALYDTGAVITAEDKLLTLSTCSYHHESGRLVVVARLTDTEKF